MMEVAKIPIINENSIAEARNKIHLLAEDLKFDSFTSNKLATITSEFSRIIQKNGVGKDIIVGFDRKGRLYRLIIIFQSIDNDSSLLMSKIFFDYLKITENEDGFKKVEAFKHIPDPGFKPTEEFIDTEKERLIRLSKAELLSDIKRKNDELLKLLDEREKADAKIQKLYNELKESQSQLVHSEKMKSVGTLAAGVAHELNNPMMGILNFVQYSLKNTSENSKIYPVLQDAFQETERCIAIVKNLLTFSHMEKEGDEAVQLQNCKVIMGRVLRLLEYRISKENVSLTNYFDENIPKIYLKSNNIQQVFFNIIINALDAVKESDRKEIYVYIKPSQPEGDFVSITVRDTGPGIAPEDLPYIFDPFFTTKPVGEGTGLGLSLSYGIVNDHGGEITCENEPGKGTSFNILLPITKKREGKWK